MMFTCHSPQEFYPRNKRESRAMSKVSSEPAVLAAT